MVDPVYAPSKYVLKSMLSFREKAHERDGLAGCKQNPIRTGARIEQRYKHNIQLHKCDSWLDKCNVKLYERNDTYSKRHKRNRNSNEKGLSMQANVDGIGLSPVYDLLL